MDDDLKNYEMSYLVPSEEEGDGVLRVLRDHGATIDEEVKPVRIRLAYPIKKETSACFGCVYFSAAPENAKKITEELNVYQTVLRFIIITPPIQKPKSIPSKFTRAVSPKPTSGIPAEGDGLSSPQDAQASHDTLSNEELEKKLEEILK